ncbi:MAG: InlB B-repeat-containing protein [Lachnospiraceae bacterium]|nr:InlB B-repeat-containing protein [Lachnospiraceae bacterium]
MGRKNRIKKMMAVVIAAAMLILNPTTVLAEQAGAVSAGAIAPEAGQVTGEAAEAAAPADSMSLDTEDDEAGEVEEARLEELVADGYGEDEYPEFTGFGSDVVCEKGEPDNDELLEGYLTKQFEEQMEENGIEPDGADTDSVIGLRLFAAVPRYRFLSSNDLAMYNGIAENIPLVAAGELTSTEFSVSGDFIYTAEELGLDKITTSGNALTPDVKSGLSKRVAKVVDALLADYPYDLFWYDKTKGTSYSYIFSVLDAGERLRISKLVFKMRVAKEYSESDEVGTTRIGKSRIDAINNTVSNAQAVVDAAVSGSDYRKLLYYRDWICNEVSYNYDAAHSSDVPYGNPWQLVWVFDGDPETKVVCEGYSKAFKWLCDLSTFDNDGIGCYLLTGKLGSGGHMWNHVTMGDDKYYMVDLTNYDDHAASRPRLFLGGYDSCTSTTYIYHGLRYTYDADARSIYSAELSLSDTDYYYTVNFDTGGKGTTPDAQTVAPESTVIRPEDPVETGYTFSGWHRDAACTEPWDFDTDTVSGDMTLYGGWNINVYTVSFDSVGGSSVSSQQVEYNSAAAEPEAPVREGAVFKGWYADREYVTEYDFEQPVTEDIILYAKWDINRYTVSFNSNGGSPVADQPVEHGSFITYPSPKPEKEGCYFVKWYADPELQTAYDIKTPVKSDLTLYAGWTEISYTVTFMTGEVNVESQTVGDDSVVLEPEALPEKEGYTLAEWYTDSDFTSAFDFNTPVTGDMTLYGKWVKKKYTVLFDSRGGSSIASQTVEYEDRITKPEESPERDGYVFFRWYKDRNCTIEWDFENGVVTDNRTLYAKWNVDESENWGDIDEAVRQRHGFTSPSDNKIPAGFWQDGVTDGMTYTGAAVTFTCIKVFYGKKLLTPDTDYTLSYKNNVNAGDRTAKIVIKGKGAYSGKLEEPFSIEPASIDEVLIGSTKTVSGQKAAPVITYKGLKLAENRQYTLDNTGKLSKSVEITITGKGNFTGERKERFEVIPKSELKKISVAIKKGTAFTYDGNPHRLTSEELIVTDASSKEALAENRDYIVTYSDNVTNAGTVKVTVTGTGDYTGSSKKSYKINPDKNAFFDIGFPQGKTYDFKKTGVTPKVEVTASLSSGGTTELKDGRDYKLSYSKNKRVGNDAVVKVTFIGNYKGAKAITDTFAIRQAELSEATAYVQMAQKMAYNEKKPKFSAYKNTPYVTLSGNLLKSSEYTVKYFIGTEELKNSSIVTPDETGRTVITVEISPKGSNYKKEKGSKPVTGSYVIEKTEAGMINLSKAKIKITEKKSTASAKIYYTGKEIRFDEADKGRQGDVQITAPDGKVYWSSDTDLEENFNVEYINNTEKGTARVIITPRDGNSKYCGYKTQTFPIRAAGI